MALGLRVAGWVTAFFRHNERICWGPRLAKHDGARGQTDQAVGAYSEYKRLADRLVALEPDNLKWRMEGLYGVENSGISLFNKRRFAEAGRQFESALGPMQNLVAVDPANPTYQKELPKVLAWRSDAERVQGHLDSAIAARSRQIALLDQAIARGASDVDLREQLIIAHQAFGLLLTSRGQSDQGIQELRSAVAQADNLIPIEPANAQWKRSAARARLYLANALLWAGQHDEASRQTENACNILAGLPPDGSANSIRTFCLTMRSRLALESGANADALALAQQALKSAGQVHSEDPLKDRFIIASIYRLIGDSRRAMGDNESAKGAWMNALPFLPPKGVETPTEMDEHAVILERLGRTAESRPLVARLQAIGFQRTN